MKQKLIFALLTILCFLSCRAQMVQTLNDVPKLATNKSQFVGKPLKNLLKEVKPQIITCYAIGGGEEQASEFLFLFVTKREFKVYRDNKKSPLSLRIFVKEPFVWDRSNKSQDISNNWTKTDEAQYGNLTVVDIHVYGQNDLTNVRRAPHWIVVSCVYKKVLIDGIYQWRYEVTKRYCDNGHLGTETQVSYSSTKVDVESCAVGEEM